MVFYEFLGPVLARSGYILPKYRLPNVITYNHGDLIQLKFPGTMKRPLREYYEEFIKKLDNSLVRKTPMSIVRLGDGEAYFLRGRLIGNVRRRHYTSDVPITDQLPKWHDYYHRHDFRLYDINWILRRLWLPIEGKKIKKDYFPLTVVYAAVANRDLFQLIRGRSVGVIGPRTKIDILKRLCRSEEYMSYLKLKKIDQFITVSEKGLCDHPEETAADIVRQMNGHYCDIYLYGMGIAKLVIVPQIRDITRRVFLDIGSGLDAMAGIISRDKPSFGNWTNYVIKDFPYETVDILWKNRFQPTEKTVRIVI